MEQQQNDPRSTRVNEDGSESPSGSFRNANLHVEGSEHPLDPTPASSESTHNASSSPPLRSVFQRGWHPGAILQQVKERVEDDITKKIQQLRAKPDESDPPAKKRPLPSLMQEETGESTSNEQEGSKARSEPIRAEVKKSVPIAPSPPNVFYEKAMEWKNKNRDESKKKTLEAHHGVVPQFVTHSTTLPNYGKIVISDVKLEDLPVWGRRSPYVLFKVDHSWETTPRASSKGPFSWNDWRGKVDVSDLFSDVHILVFAAKKGSEVLAMEDEYVGKAIIPLSNLALRFSDPWLRTLFTGTRSGPMVHTLDICVDLLPLPPKASSYTRCVTGLPPSGMERPKEPLGRVRMVLTLKCSVPLAKALLTVPPTREIPFPARNEEMNSTLLHQRNMRLKSILENYNWVFPTLVDGLLSWESPFATWIWLTIFTQIMLFSEVYHLPFFIAMCAVLGSYFVNKLNKKRQKKVAPIIFSDETTMDPEIPQTLPQKIRALQTLVGLVQGLLGIVATSLERFFYAFSWDDPFVSLMLSMCLLAGGFAVSVAWGLLLHTAFLWRPLLYLAGLMLHVPTSWQARLQRQFRAALKRYNAQQQKQLDLSTPGGLHASFPNSIEEMLEEKSKPASHVDQLEDSTTRLRAIATTWSDMLRNLMKRIPDATEIDHRRIAQARVWDAKADKLE